MGTTISHSIEETFRAGRALAARLKPGQTVALAGTLGAGKTHFVKGIAEEFGCQPEGITSPTFTLIHEYTSARIPLWHFDFYRLDTADEALQIGLDDYLDGDGVCLIEWADKFPELLPADTIWITIRILPDDSREILETDAQSRPHLPAE